MKQERALFFALDNSENGQTTSWYNNTTGTNGGYGNDGHVHGLEKIIAFYEHESQHAYHQQ